MLNSPPKKGDPLARALRQARTALLTVVVFSFTINALMLTVPVYMLQIYDRVLTSRSHETLIMLSVLAFALLLTVGLLEFARSRVLVRVGGRIDGQLNTKLFESLFSQRSDGSRSGAQALRDLESVRMFLTGNALLALIDDDNRKAADEQGFEQAKADFAALVEQANWLRGGGMTSPAIVRRHAREASSIVSSVIAGVAVLGITLASVL